MSRKFIAIAVITLLSIGCSNEETKEPLLTKAPYASLTDSIRMIPKNADLYYRRGVLLFQNDQKKLAENDLRSAWKIQPKEEYALSLTTLLREKNPNEAIYFLQQAIDQFPNSIALHIGLARGYQSKGDIDKALTICNQMLNGIPNQLDALLLKTELLKDQNKNEEATNTLEKAYQYAPGDREIGYKLAFDYAESKNPKVLLLTDTLIKNDGARPKAEPYYFKGLYYSNIGNKTEALNYFDKAIHQDYYFLNAYINKGIVYYDAKQYNDALKTFQLAATISPSFDDAYYWMGKTDEAMGNKDEAKYNYQRAYSLNKENTEAKKAAEKL